MTNRTARDETAQLLLDKERVEAQWNALVDDLREQGYTDKEICRILYSSELAGTV